MNDQERKQLNKRYRALKSLLKPVQDVIEKKLYYLQNNLFDQIDAEVRETFVEFKNLMPSYNPHSFIEGGYYKPEAVYAYLLRAVSRLESELEEVSAAALSGPLLAFPFVANAKIREIIERDHRELLTAFSSGCKKSSLILAGGIIEAILLDFVQQNLAAAQSSAKAPKDPDPLTWGLDNLIEVSVDIKPDLQPVQMMSHTVRKYRNLIHPAVEVRNNMKVEIEEASVAINVVNILHRELS